MQCEVRLLVAARGDSAQLSRRQTRTKHARGGAVNRSLRRRVRRHSQPLARQSAGAAAAVLRIDTGAATGPGGQKDCRRSKFDAGTVVAASDSKSARRTTRTRAQAAPVETLRDGATGRGLEQLRLPVMHAVAASSSSAGQKLAAACVLGGGHLRRATPPPWSIRLA